MTSTGFSDDLLTDDKNRKLEIKRGAFDREFRLLVKQCQETIQARYGNILDAAEMRRELICLNRYVSIYNSMKPEEHYIYFETLYNRNRESILNSLKSDQWIRSGQIVIQFGEGIRGMVEKCRQIRIMLSDIFQIACELQAEAERALDGIDDQFISSVGGKDLIRPNIILLHLIRIFYHLIDTHDKVTLGNIVSQLETDLGIPLDKRTISDGSASSSTAESSSGQQSAAGTGLSGLFDLATKMMRRIGYEPPPGMKPPSETEITNVINSVFNNEVTQNAIQGMFTSLQGCNDFGSAVQTVVRNVTDPSTMEAIQGSVMQTAQIASGENIPTSSSSTN